MTLRLTVLGSGTIVPSQVRRATSLLLEGGGVGLQPDAISAFTWTLQGPDGSSAVLDDPTSQHPILTPKPQFAKTKAPV